MHLFLHVMYVSPDSVVDFTNHKSMCFMYFSLCTAFYFGSFRYTLVYVLIVRGQFT